MKVVQETEAYITIKDHKDVLSNKIKCPLINPSKSSISKISKAIFNTINKNVVQNQLIEKSI